MGCCEATNPEMDGFVSHVDETAAGWQPIDLVCGRREMIRGLLVAAAGLAMTACRTPANTNGAPAPTKLRLAFCGQLLCVVPYEVARARGHFAEQGLDVELVYTRGGNAAMQALVGGAVEYAGTSFDVALQAAANGATIRRFASTGRLPLFALAVAPARSRQIDSVARLTGATVAVSALGNADHALLLFLLDRAKVDPKSVRVAAIGTNAFEALRQNQIDAAMVQEPALTLVVQAGGRELVNFMEIEQATRHLGGAYEFMGVSVRAGERDRRLLEMRRMAAALAAGLADTRSLPPDDVIAALPPPLLAGNDAMQLRNIITRYRLSLYPEAVTIVPDAAERVRRSQEIAGLLQPGRVDLAQLLDTAVLQK
jgi:NitT/TauT family transport system substrate-binding protein